MKGGQVPQHEVGGYNVMKRGMNTTSWHVLTNLLIHSKHREAIVSQFIVQTSLCQTRFTPEA